METKINKIALRPESGSYEFYHWKILWSSAFEQDEKLFRLDVALVDTDAGDWHARFVRVETLEVLKNLPKLLCGCAYSGEILDMQDAEILWPDLANEFTWSAPECDDEACSI